MPHPPTREGRQAASPSSALRSSRFVTIASPPRRVARPVGFRPVAVQLDPVAVRITQIDRLAHAVVRGAVDFVSGLHQTFEHGGKCRTVGIEDRSVKKPGMAGRGWRAALRLPGVQPDMVVIAASRKKGGVVTVTLHDLEPEEAGIEADGAVKVRDP